MKTKLLVTALTAALASPVAFAKAELKNEDDKGNWVSLTGQVTTAAAIGSDFRETFNVLEPDNSGSRFRIRAQKKWGGLKVGLRYELQNRDDSLGRPAQISDLRYSDVYISGGFGKIALGQGDGAANGGALK